jgi:tRNA/rRNA methyltransferase
LPEIIFILVNPAREENIGAAARALKTMGIDKLYLVAPLANHLGEKAKATAHASNEILEKALIFNRLEDALKNIDLTIASTARKRSLVETFHMVDELPQMIMDKGDTIANVAIVFGGEESGLSNDHLSLCHIMSTIPMASSYPSLNLAQSVMVYATYLSKLTINVKTSMPPMPVKAELPIIREKAEQILADVKMLPDNLIYSRIMERLMLLNKDDINLFHSFCKYYLTKYHGRIK